MAEQNQEITYLPYGQDEISQQDLMTSLANGVPSYLESKRWAKKDKYRQAWLNAYQDIINHGLTANAANIIKCADIDGFLVGGASLDAMSFTGIINAVHDVHERDRRPTGGLSALNPPALNENMFTWKELASADALVKAHADTHAWRAQLALAAYRTVGFQWLERNAAETLLQNADSSGADTELIVSNPDLLRDAIWDDRRDIILRIMRIIDNHGLRGVKSVDEWLVMQDDGLTHDERCERLTAARADYNADVAYDELMDGSIPRDVFDAIFKAGYYAADADTRERHWRRRGIDKHAWRG